MTRFLWRRLHSTYSTILHLPRVNVYKFGDGDAALPVFKDFEWSIRDGENWAVVGASSKSSMIQLLTGELRISPPPLSGLYPFLHGRDIYEAVSLVSFATRLDTSGGGAFYDFTARYGALRDGDKTTLRESLEGSSSLEQLNTLAVELNLDNLLHLPLVALSNGQTRRARILTALLRTPKLLILDEPFTGLDVQHRPRLSNLLHKLHQKQSPRIIIAIRPQDPLPEWITHVLALSSADDVQHGSVQEMRHVLEKLANPVHAEIKFSQQNASNTAGDEYVSMKNVTVAYHERVVLDNLDWTIRAGDRWHLQGANGSGKTTLTSILNGSHPQSYTQHHLHLFSKPRADQPTVILQQKIGLVSPELFNAFPRRLGPGALTVREAIATGFDGNYVYRKRTKEEDARIYELVTSFWVDGLTASNSMEEWLEKPFALLAPGEQSFTLLLRALTTRPKLLILDEVFSGMDERMVEMGGAYLRKEIGADQAIIFIGHWESEVPWTKEDGLKVVRLENGKTIFP